MPRVIIEQMSVEQQAFHIVMSWAVQMPAVTRFEHMPNWALFNRAKEYLAISAAAWSPSRQAAVNVATRLFLKHTRALLNEVRDEEATVERRIHRAVQQTGLPLNFREPVENLVRMVSNEYRLERSISSWAMHGYNGRRFTRQGANQLYGILRETLRPDVDSNTEESDAEG